MAVTKIIPIRATIEKSIDYICNPKKTDGSLYMHSEHCTPRTAALEFQHYLSQTRAGGNTIGRHLIQSFAPGEVAPDVAHEIGKRLAAEILQGQYAYVMTTHVDRGHIHNHFVWCTANIQTHNKYRSNKRTYHDIRDASDRLCAEKGLSVIVPQGIGKSYAEYQADKQGTSWKSKLKAAMDAVLSESADFGDFLLRMEARGYEVKKGARLSFRAPEQQRFTRAETLGAAYAEDALRRRVSEDISAPESKPLQAVIDIEGNEKIKSSPGYRQWAAVFNLKQSAAALSLIEQYGGMDAFEQLYNQAGRDKLSLAEELNAMAAEIKSLAALRDTIRIYGRTKAIFKQCRDAPSKRKQEKLYQENKEDIEAHKRARKSLSSMPSPVPSTKAITAEIERLRSARADVQTRYKENGTQLKEMYTISKNLRSLLRRHKPLTHANDERS